MATVESPENVAEVLETQLNISSGLPVPSDSSVEHVIDVETDFPHLNKLKDLYVILWPYFVLC